MKLENFEDIDVWKEARLLVKENTETRTLSIENSP
jgi:hypothetical protein